MWLAKNGTFEFGEYTIVVEYDGDGGIDIEVFDELGGLIEGLFISNSEGSDETGLDVNIN